MKTFLNFLKKAAGFLPSPVLLYFKKRYYCRLLQNFDYANEPETKYLNALVPPRALVLDIGANIGVYTRILADLVGPYGRVIAYEPMPDTFSILRYNVEKLKLSAVTLYQAAVSDADGFVYMDIPRGGTFYEARISSKGKKIKACKLDNQSFRRLLKTRSVEFIKCDVEGHELAALKGAGMLLRRDRPALLIEKSGNHKNVQQFLTSLGYLEYPVAGRPNSFFLHRLSKHYGEDIFTKPLKP